MKPFLLLSSLILFIPTAYVLGLYVMFLTDTRFTLEEMDLNQNGFVSFTEADYVSSSGQREIMMNEEKCIEYFAYKDGLPLKVVCGISE